MSVNYDALLRPKTLDEVIGIPKVKRRLRTIITAYRKQNTRPANILLSGPPGVGKTLLSHVIANELGVDVTVTTGAEVSDDAWQVQTDMTTGDNVLFIDEIHQLNKKGQDILLPWLEQGGFEYTKLSYNMTTRRSTWEKSWKAFTCIGATTRPDPLQAAFDQRFKLRIFLSLYTEGELGQIAGRSARLLNLFIAPDGLREVARRSKGTPRIVNNQLWYIQQYAIANDIRVLYPGDVDDALNELGIDQLGLNDQDRFYLETLATFDRPTGLRVLADSMMATSDAIRNTEPFLLKSGLVQLSPRGRILTDKGKQHIT